MAGRIASAASLAWGRERRARTRAWEAPRTASTSRFAESSRNPFTPRRGFSTMSTAPSSSACSATSVPRAASPEHTSTGMGSSDMIFRRKVSPSMRGISMSRTRASGRKPRIFCWAMSGSAATSTCMPTRERMASRACRTTAESSTTMTRVGPAGRSEGRRLAKGIGRLGGVSGTRGAISS
jgi:hypothetical protein